MKNLVLWIITLSFPVFLTSCSADDLTEHYNESGTVLNKSLINPENNTNEYDFIGILQNDILEAYLSGNHNHQSVEEIAEEIQSLIYHYSNIELMNLNIEEITNIIDSPEDTLNTVILDSHLSSEAKTRLTGFINSLLYLLRDEYENQYEFIVLYESSIIEDSLLNNEDKRVILTTTTILRYSLYDDDRKDKDWETSVGHITAAVSGALENQLVAVNMFLVTGISIKTLYAD